MSAKLFTVDAPEFVYEPVRYTFERPSSVSAVPLHAPVPVKFVYEMIFPLGAYLSKNTAFCVDRGIV